ncbi:MAG: efflux RND transporter permease subunit [bacterium]
MLSIPRLSINRPITITMIFTAIIMFGAISLFNLAVELMPNTSFGTITIFVGIRGGLPPPQIENMITRKIEEAVSGVGHLKNIISTSKMNRAVITLEFEPGTDMDFAALEVRENFNKVKDDLPYDQIEKPLIARYQESDLPIMILGLTSNEYSPEFMRELVEDTLRDKLLRVNGVANVEIGGGRERKILVELEQSRIQAFGISIQKVINAISTANVDLLVGGTDTSIRHIGTKATGSFKDLNELKELPIDTKENFGIVRLKDIANVKDSFMEAESYSRLGMQGQKLKDAISIYIQKESTSNTIAVSKRLEGIINNFTEELKQKYPSINLNIVSAQYRLINSAINTVKSSLLWGMLLSILILFLFLRRFMYTYVVFAVMLISIMFALLLVYMTNLLASSSISLNVMSLSGLALAVGMLLDNSIVVLENIVSKRKEIGENQERKEIIIMASEEMMLAIAASTLTTIVVFLPITFIAKQVRILYSDLSVTVIYSLLASLFVALSAVPFFVNMIKDKKQYKKLISDKVSNKIESFNFYIKKIVRYIVLFIYRIFNISFGKYLNLKFLLPIIVILLLAGSIYCLIAKLAPLALGLFAIFIILYGVRMLSDEAGNRKLRTILKNKHTFKYYYLKVTFFFFKYRYITLCFTAFILIISMFMYKYNLDKEFIGSTEQNEFTIFIELPSGTKLELTDKVVSEVEKKLSEIPEIADTLKTTQSRVEGWSSKIYITLLPKKERTRSTEEIIDNLREHLKGIGKEYDTFIYFSEPQTSREFIVDVFGYDYDKLAEIANKIANELEGFTKQNKEKGFVDIKLRYRPGRPTYDFNIDKAKSATHKLTTKNIADALHAQLRGMRASFFHTQSKEVEIVPRLAEQYRSNLKSIKEDLTIVNSDRKNIYVKDLTRPDAKAFGLVPSEIWRKNKTRMIQVSATLDDISLAKAAAAVNSIISTLKLPKHYYCEIGGEYDQMVQNEIEFKFAILISILLVYFVLAALFESYSQPFIILLTDPLALIGVVLAIFATVNIITVGVFIGALMLSGIVVNNGIILIDKINSSVKNKTIITKSILIKTIIRSSLNRLRPILMTTLTTVFGVLPMALDRSESSNLWSPLAITVIGGLTTSTFLTLILIPSVYYIFYEIGEWAKSKLGKVFIFKKS